MIGPPPKVTLYTKFSRFACQGELYRDPHLTAWERFMYQPTLRIFDDVRIRTGGPLIITSGRRSRVLQDRLIREKKTRAKYSPHLYGLALDVRVPFARMTREEFVQLVRDSSVRLGLPVRIGWKLYAKKRTRHIHFDTAPVWVSDPDMASLYVKFPKRILAAYKAVGLEW